MGVVPRRVELTGELPVRIESALNAGTGTLLNLSAGGAYVATPMLLLPQAQVRLGIRLPNVDEDLEAEAVVVWENRGPMRRGGLPPGYGLRFIRLTEKAAVSIRRLIDPPAKARPADDLAASTIAFEPRPDLAATTPAPSLDDEPGGPPYRLRGSAIRSIVPKGRPGVFVLAYDRSQDALVGRADDDLRTTLSGFIGEYAYFYHEVVDRTDERFHRECELFHRLGGDRGQLDNVEHPSPPAGSALACPICRR